MKTFAALVIFVPWSLLAAGALRFLPRLFPRRPWHVGAASLFQSRALSPEPRAGRFWLTRLFSRPPRVLTIGRHCHGSSRGPSVTPPLPVNRSLYV